MKLYVLETQKYFFMEFLGAFVTLQDHLILPNPVVKSKFEVLNIFAYYTSGVTS